MMRKKIITGSLILLVAISNLPIRLFAEENNTVDLQLLPLRAAAECQGAIVLWDAQTSSITIQKDGFNAKIQIGSTQAMLNNQKILLKAAPTLDAENRAMIDYTFLRPLFVSENDPYAKIKDIVIPEIYANMDKVSIAGTSLAFVDIGKPEPWVQGFGYANVSKRELVTKDTAFEIGSITKTFTAMGIMQLVEQGKVSLDGKVTDYLPEFSIQPHPDRGGDYRDITLRMLGQHTSGIIGTYIPQFFSYDSSNYKRFNMLIKDLGQTYLCFAPSESYAYSNEAVSLLVAVISASAEPEALYLDGYTAYIEEKILKPLKMDHTAFLPKDYIHESNGYINAATEDKRTFLSVVPAGNLRSSASDMANYMTMLLSGGLFDGVQVISKESINAMLTAETLQAQFATSQKMGFIWMPFDLKDKTVWYHPGDTLNFHNGFAIDPASGLGVFISCNSSTASGLAGNLSLKILALAIGQKTGITPEFLSYPDTEPSKTVEIEAMRQYEGIYGPVNMSVSVGEAGLQYSYAGQTIQLVLQDDGTFIDSVAGLRWFFEPTDDGGMIAGYYGGGSSRFYSSERITNAHGEFAGQFIGKWMFMDSENDICTFTQYGNIEITMEDDLPLLTLGGVQFILCFTDETTCYISGRGRAQGDVFKLVHEDGQDYLIYDGAKYIR